jgi:hypothetical protein
LLVNPRFRHFPLAIGFIGVGFGIITMFILRLFYGKSVDDFNMTLAKGTEGPQLIANVGHAFTLAWVAYALQVIPIITLLTVPIMEKLPVQF